MDVCSVIKERLQDLGLEQKDLAAAAQVTESYVSQLLNRKKLPPAPERTDIYEKIGLALKLANGELETLVRAQRLEALKRNYDEPKGGLLKETRSLILRKCKVTRRDQVRSIFERHPFGELERLVTQKLLDVVSQVARSELDNKTWLQDFAQLSGCSYEQMRVIMLEFLDTDLFNISNEGCRSFLEPLIACWDINLATFDMEVTLHERLASGETTRFAFVESGQESTVEDEPGLIDFMQDATLANEISGDELEHLRQLRFSGRQPNRIFYYRMLQILRDPLHYLDMEA